MRIYLIILMLILAGCANAGTYITGPFKVSFDQAMNLTAQLPLEQDSLQGFPTTYYVLSGPDLRIYIADDTSDLPPADVDIEQSIAQFRSIATIKKVDRRIDGSPGELAEIVFSENHTAYAANWWADPHAAVLVTSTLPFNQTSRILKTIHIERIS